MHEPPPCHSLACAGEQAPGLFDESTVLGKAELHSQAAEERAIATDVMRLAPNIPEQVRRQWRTDPGKVAVAPLACNVNVHTSSPDTAHTPILHPYMSRLPDQCLPFYYTFARSNGMPDLHGCPCPYLFAQTRRSGSATRPVSARPLVGDVAHQLLTAAQATGVCVCVVRGASSPFYLPQQ